jgi:putative aldouronate transport system permease protein
VGVSGLRETFADRVFNAVNVVIMTLICICITYPLYFVFIASFTDPAVVNTTPLLLYPKRLFMGGYDRIFSYPPLWKGYFNTVIYTVAGTAVSIGITIPAAYAFSRRDMAGRRFLMFVFTFTMCFSGGIIPLYLILIKLKIYNTLWAIALPGAVSVYNLIVCRTFFETTIPMELLEASRLDGCTDFLFFFRIVLPISSTIIAVMMLFYATGIWNSFMNALMFLRDEDKMPIQIVVRNLILVNQVQTFTMDINSMIERQKLAEQLKYAIIVVAAGPLLLVYPVLQKYFAKGVLIGSVKG